MADKFLLSAPALKSSYITWRRMKQRCLDKNCKSFHRYGGRGIGICDRWMIFRNFLNDMGKRPKGLSIDRIDNNKGYSKENCRWATVKEQARNRRSNTFVTYNNVSRTLAEWADVADIKYSTLKQRFYVYKWTFGRCLLPPLK